MIGTQLGEQKGTTQIVLDEWETLKTEQTKDRSGAGQTIHELVVLNRSIPKQLCFFIKSR